MQFVKLQVGDPTTITLPFEGVEALHLRENDEIAIEVAGDRIILAGVSQDFQDAWAAYKEIEPRYHNANRQLGE